MSTVLAPEPVSFRGNDMDPVVRLARRAHGSESLPALEHLLVNDLRVLVPHEHSALLLVAAGETKLAATGGETSAGLESLRAVLPLFVQQEGIAVVTVDGPSTGFDDDEATTRIAEVLRGSGQRAMISVPLIHHGRTLAFLLMFYIHHPLPGPADLRPLAELAPLLASALSREQLLASS
ncbi:MAG: hypothetical protein ACE5F1_07860, partial [Planctomycetota bacterium]